jgi:hypothetical protein
VIARFRPPRRPEVTSKRARQVVEWADVVFYIFTLGILAASLIVALVTCGPEFARLLQ